ncbi:hypothetical protein EMCRGX_G022001 [Ephydatia muelleri]
MINILTLLICVAIAARTSDAVFVGHEKSPVMTTCKMCEGLTMLLGNSMKDSVSQIAGKERLYKECETSGIYSQMCTTLVGNHYVDMWALLAMEMEPDVVCSKLELCTNTSVQIDLCPICESILPQVQVIVDKASTEVEVCTLMEILCNQLPYDPEVFAACNNDIQTKLPKIWTTLKDCVDNATACCIKLKACKASDPMPFTPDFVENSISNVQDNATCPPLNCTTCEGALAQLQFIVDSNSTEQNIFDLLQLACGELPSPYYQDLCNEFMQNNFSVYWGKLKTCLDNPKTCCTTLRACNSTAFDIDFLAEGLSKRSLKNH